jgi:hypothetical protein
MFVLYFTLNSKGSTMTVNTPKTNAHSHTSNNSEAVTTNEHNINVNNMKDITHNITTTTSNDLIVASIVDEDALPFVKEHMPKTIALGTSNLVYRRNPESCEVEPRKFFYDGNVIFDIRTDGLDESGQPITYEEAGDSPALPKDLFEYEFEVGINLAFAATVLFKQFKNTDRRREFVRSAANYLLSAGWTQNAIHFLIIDFAKIAGDNDADSYGMAIQAVVDAIYKAGRSELVDCIGEGSVAAVEASLRDVDELREDLHLDELKSDFAPSEGRSPSPFPPSELRATNPMLRVWR